MKVKEAQAEAAAALGNVAFKVGDLGDTLKTVEEVLNKRYETVRRQGRAWPRTWSTWTRSQEKENERKALEQKALAEFLASARASGGPAAPKPRPRRQGHRPRPQTEMPDRRRRGHLANSAPTRRSAETSGVRRGTARWAESTCRLATQARHASQRSAGFSPAR